MTGAPEIGTLQQSSHPDDVAAAFVLFADLERRAHEAGYVTEKGAA